MTSCYSLALFLDRQDELNRAFQIRKMGRQQAVRGFSEAWVNYSGNTNCFLRRRLPSPDLRRENVSFGAVFCGDPQLAELARERAVAAPTRFSLLGLTHTLSTPGPLHAIASYVHQPIFSWDALVCTSQAAKSAVSAVLDHAESGLIARGGSPPHRPQLPVIPLGVSTKEFSQLGDRFEARQRLGVERQAMVVLWTGRFEVHCKAHHAATFRALAHAASLAPNRRWLLLMYGTAVMPGIPKALQKAARQLCPAVEVRFLDGHNRELMPVCLAASNVFLSLVDSLQETFGLTPVEAMASGIPVVVSDWNGYRDSVSDGRTGFLVPTTTFWPGTSDRQMLPCIFPESELDAVATRLTSQVKVDFNYAGNMLSRLAISPELSVAMGHLARQSMLHSRDWSVVFAEYDELLADLQQRREHASKNNVFSSRLRRAHLLPQWKNIFMDWPSHSLDIGAKFVVAEPSPGIDLHAYLQLDLHLLYSSILPEVDLILEVFTAAEKLHFFEVPQLTPLLQKPLNPRYLEALGFLLKHGYLNVLT